MDAQRIGRLVRDLINEDGYPLELARVESDQNEWSVHVRTRAGQTIRIGIGRTSRIADVRDLLRARFDAVS